MHVLVYGCMIYDVALFYEKKIIIIKLGILALVREKKNDKKIIII